MKLQVVVGGQAGSEGKGHVAAQLALDMIAPTCVRVAGPNAGHTVVNPDTGKSHALRQVPVGLVTNPEAWGCIAAGSEVDIDVLADEVNMLEADGIRVRRRLSIDPAATILTEHHKKVEAEAGLSERIGSTGKGIGAARADRIMRRAEIAYEYAHELGQLGRVESAVDVIYLRERDVQIEGTQGYRLGLHTTNYPQVTSSDCTALDFLAMARVNPWLFPPEALQIWVVYRPYPIRVAGNSGTLTGETTWAALDLPEEKTTVTKKTRRVGVWDGHQAREAFEANGGLFGTTPVAGWGQRPITAPVRTALTMVDQLDPKLAGSTVLHDLLNSEPYQQFLQQYIRDLGVAPQLVTTSDRTAIRLAL